jgi:putative transposase
MSGARNCYDNAVVESWFGLPMRERVHRRHYRTLQEARQDMVDYIERFYNRRRPHGAEGRMSTLQLEESTLNQPVH